MGCARTAFGSLLTLAILAGCSTTDALTPPVDVGGGRFPNSPPVTDRDLQSMADNQQPVYPSRAEPPPQQARQTAPVYRQAIESQPVSPPARQAPALAKPGTGAPPSTLDDQAAGMAGDTPRRTSQPPSGSAAAPVAQVSGDKTIRFLPIIGAPLEAVTPLSRQLGAEARNRGFVIKGSSDSSAAHVLKGYFSAVSGGGTITVTYVWDILDNNGARLNRIQGQESFPGNAGDPWSAVPASVMQNIAAKTMDSYGRWQAGP